MSIIKCPECQKEISDTSISCPNCGCPIVTATTDIKKKGLSERTKMYGIALIHSVIMTLLSITGRVYSYNSSSFLYDGGREIYLALSKLLSVAIIGVIIVSILLIIKYVTKRSNLKILNSYETLFITFSSYALSFCIGFLCYAVSAYHLGMSVSCIIQISIIISIIAAMCLFVKFKMKMSFSYYKLSFAIWAIYIILNSVFYDSSLALLIIILLVPIIVGVSWIISAIRHKKIDSVN